MRRRHFLLVFTAPTLLLSAALGYGMWGDGGTATVPARETTSPTRPVAALVQSAVNDVVGDASDDESVSTPVVHQPSDDDAPTNSVFAVGDIMLSRAVGAAIRAKNDVHFPFARTSELSSGADIAFANLETSITPGRPIADNEMTFRADPETVDGLKDAGFDVVSLANNHTPNFGQAGLLDTFKYLSDADIRYVGAGTDDASAHLPAIVERNGVRFAFLAYNDHDVVPASYAAGDAHAGTAIMNVERVAKDVATVRQSADVVIVSMHSGHEYSFVPDASQTVFAHAAIDAGADLVLGHHVHVVQTVEGYKGKLIFYGLGNFVFDQTWSVPTREGLALRLGFTGAQLTSAEAIPVYIEAGGQPRVAVGRQARETLDRLGVDLDEKDGKYFVPLP